ncbi:AmfS protein [Streptomyces sp. GBA 94-10 4N24]|nr:AmfS protein [Streptomyces sp. GBA 94-10 4N24]ESQ04766.1 AmfS protein [Streptomyces sp. PVA_94-07]UZN59450.1 AmfS protein [Streptomyces sp. GBA 94-10 4N24]WDV31814.1 SapB/AmfS family lanthipeptide [Streptomyces sp. AD16]
MAVARPLDTKEYVMALLDLQAMDTPQEEAVGDLATGSQISLLICEYSSLSVTLCTP